MNGHHRAGQLTIKAVMPLRKPTQTDWRPAYNNLGYTAEGIFVPQGGLDSGDNLLLDLLAEAFVTIPV